MGYQIIKEPNGKRYALWSSIIDNFVVMNATREEIVDFLVDQERERIETSTDTIIAKLEKGESPYYQFTKTWQEALDWIKEAHGKKEMQKVKTIGETIDANNSDCKR